MHTGPRHRTARVLRWSSVGMRRAGRARRLSTGSNSTLRLACARSLRRHRSQYRWRSFVSLRIGSGSRRDGRNVPVRKSVNSRDAEGVSAAALIIVKIAWRGESASTWQSWKHEKHGLPTVILRQAQWRVVREHGARFTGCAVEVHVALQHAWRSDACPPWTDGADCYAVCVGLLLCARDSRARFFVGVRPGGSDFMRAACRCSDGYCRCDCEVADGELHVELVDRVVERMRTEERNTLYV
jgi:hypothetical protein